MFGSRVGLSGTADLMALFLPTTCTASLLAFGDNMLMRKTLELDFVWEGTVAYGS